MDTIRLTIEGVKNIHHAEIDLPFENGVYSLVGTNGCGKSTILLLLSHLVYSKALDILKPEDYSSDTSITYEIGGTTNTCYFSKKGRKWKSSKEKELFHENGMYEGSLFYGTRFDDSTVIDKYIASDSFDKKNIVLADEYVQETLSYILHGDKDHYKTLSRIKNRKIAERIGVKNNPYFLEINGRYISQYRMSSGECLLISLLHFIYNSIIRQSLPEDKKVLVLIDEIELALHPIAIRRLITLLKELAKDHENLIVILTSHSPEVIKSIKPSNLYKVENNDGEVTLESNCYPSYLIRDVYTHDGFDYVILVEDALAMAVVKRVLLDNNLQSGKLVQILPAGGWLNVLDLHNAIIQSNLLGLNASVVSVLDGDVEEKFQDDKYKRYNNLKKLFLPILSIEKFLYEKLITNQDRKFVKLINDKYFPIKSIDEIIKEHKTEYKDGCSQLNKKFYKSIIKDLESRNVSEEEFITHLCDDIIKTVNFDYFTETLRSILQ